VSGYVLSADADFDLDEIWEYIAADNIEAAVHRIENRSMRRRIEIVAVTHCPHGFAGVPVASAQRRV